MELLTTAIWVISFSTLVISAKHRNIVHLNENTVCHIKRSCLDCLQLPQCSWCSSENKCYAVRLTYQGYCENDTIHHVDYGMSLKKNAECACAGGKLERNCVPPGAAQEIECSGRGQCICGRCFCDSIPDSEHPTKTVMGEYCDYDNFSCDGSKCNEGPYYINEQKTNYEDTDGEADVVQPIEE